LKFGMDFMPLVSCLKSYSLIFFNRYQQNGLSNTWGGGDDDNDGITLDHLRMHYNRHRTWLRHHPWWYQRPRWHMCMECGVKSTLEFSYTPKCKPFQSYLLHCFATA
jgi:hypothetical protein